MCKVCKLSSKVPGIVDFVDRELDRGTSYRKIAKGVIAKFTVGISYESIRIHGKHRAGQAIEKEEPPFHIAITTPRRKDVGIRRSRRL